MAQLDVLSVEEERAAAEAVVAARRGAWAAIFACRPVAPTVTGLIERFSPDAHVVREQLDAVAATAQGRGAYAAAAGELVAALGHADVDGIALALVRNDLICLRSGKPPKHIRHPEIAPHLRPILDAIAVLAVAREHFVKSNLRLVFTVARRHHHHISMSFHDLIQEGNLGLMKAVDRFDHRRGFRFSTYAMWWIRHAIGRAIADRDREVRLPVHLRDRLHALRRARRNFETAHGRPPTDEELCADTGITPQLLAATTMVPTVSDSLDQPIGDDETVTLADFVEDRPDKDADAEIDLRRVQSYIPDLLDVLSPIESDIIRARFGLEGDELPFRVLGNRHRLSRERIRQLQEQALEKLGRELRRRGLHGELRSIICGSPGESARDDV